MSINGPVGALVVVGAVWLTAELLYVWKRHREHERDDRAIRGVDDPRMPDDWKPEDIERSRQDFLRIERKRRGR